MAGITGGAGGPGMDTADFFAKFFNGQPMFAFDFGPDMGGGGPRRRAGKGDDSMIPHDVTLEDLYNGKSVKINMEKDVICTQCKGCVGSLFNHWTMDNPVA
jgi:DnaJ family protein A protein 2